jgi:hypothetical protein
MNCGTHIAPCHRCAVTGTLTTLAKDLITAHVTDALARAGRPSRGFNPPALRGVGFESLSGHMS